MSVISFLPHAASIWGSCQTIFGISNIYQGNVLNGMKNTLIGMNLSELGYALIRPVGTPPLTKISLGVNHVVEVAKGLVNVVQGIRKRSFDQTCRGTAQMAFGVACTATIASLDDDMFIRARIIVMLSMAAVSSAIAWRGVKEFANDRKGIGKTILGVAGFAVTAYMVYNLYKDLTWRSYSPDGTPSLQQCESFVQSHKDELNQIYETRGEIGGWKKIGEGWSKIALIHPESPHIMIKIPNRLGRTSDDMLLQFNNIQNARYIALINKYQHIAIPDSHLIRIEKGNVLCETKFEFDHEYADECRQAATIELNDFLKTGKFCDIGLRHNAGFLKGSCNLGIFDFDCKW
jgi:hypothetical protein